MTNWLPTIKSDFYAIWTDFGFKIAIKALILNHLNDTDYII